MNNKYYFLGDEDARNNAIKENMNRINQSKENKAILIEKQDIAFIKMMKKLIILIEIVDSLA